MAAKLDVHQYHTGRLLPNKLPKTIESLEDLPENFVYRAEKLCSSKITDGFLRDFYFNYREVF